MTNFVSVATSAARYQDISLNPQKLAGQCAKLKCCLNYEVDAYVESVKQLPSKEIRLETKDNTYFYFKADIFSRMLTYSTDKNVPANLVTIPAKRAFEVIALNKNGVKPDNLDGKGNEEKERSAFGDILGQDSLTRFDKARKKKRKKGNGGNPNSGEGKDGADNRQDGRQENRQENRKRQGGGNNRPRRGGDNGNGNRRGSNGGEQSRGNRPPRRDNRNDGQRGKDNGNKPKSSEPKPSGE